MTKKEIEKGAGLLLAAVSGCEQMVELLHAAVHYCYEQEKTAKNLTPKGYAGFTRIHHIWTEGIPDAPKLFMGSPIQDRDMGKRNPDGAFPVHNGLSSRNHSDSSICGNLCAAG